MNEPRVPRTIERLLGQTRWMRRLAGELCADAASAEDLVQDAWVTALEHPPRDERAARTWFARVLANQSRERHRGQSARRAREQRTARIEALPSTEDVVARAEIGRRLVECVLALEEPNRSTVLYRYFDELSAEEIAAREGISSSTVRTRLARGLALLRERLEREDGRSWMSSLALLARWNAGSSSSTAAAVGAGGAVGASSGAVVPLTLVGVIGMSTLVKVGICIALVGVAAWFAWPENPPLIDMPHTAASPSESRAIESPKSNAPPSERLAIVEPPHPPTSSTTPAVVVPPRSEELSDEEIAKLQIAIPPGTIEGIVVRGRKPVASGAVYCWPSQDPLPEHPRESWSDVVRNATDARLRTTLDIHGQFRFSALRTSLYRFGIDLGDGVRSECLVDVFADKPGRCVVIVLGSARLDGHVFDHDGKPIAGARVTISLANTRDRVAEGFFTSRTTSAKGVYAITEIAAGKYWLTADLNPSAKVGLQPDLMLQIPPIHEGEVRTFDIGSPQRSGVWSGTVRARTGNAVPGPGRIALQDRSTKVYSESTYDEDGRFRIPLRPGQYDVRVSTRSKFDVTVGSMKVGKTDLEHDIELRGSRLRGLVIDASTQMPWARAYPHVQASIHLDGNEYPDAFHPSNVGADGTFIIDGVEPGTWILDTRFVVGEGSVPGGGNTVPGNTVRGLNVTVLPDDLELPVRIVLQAP